MAEPNILLTRIDNRLIHGQVGMTWTNWLGANLVVVADDEIAADPVQQNLMEMALTGNVGARFFTLQKTIDVIHKAAPSQKIFLVVRTRKTRSPSSRVAYPSRKSTSATSTSLKARSR